MPDLTLYHAHTLGVRSVIWDTDTTTSHADSGQEYQAISGLDGKFIPVPFDTGSNSVHVVANMWMADDDSYSELVFAINADNYFKIQMNKNHLRMIEKLDGGAETVVGQVDHGEQDFQNATGTVFISTNRSIYFTTYLEQNTVMNTSPDVDLSEFQHFGVGGNMIGSPETRQQSYIIRST